MHLVTMETVAPMYQGKKTNSEECIFCYKSLQSCLEWTQLFCGFPVCLVKLREETVRT